MKRFLLTFAAMLLVSVGAFAQSSETPLKGDVNEDGVVDVADINAIIKIMKDGGGIGQETAYYYYAGWTLPTVDNVDKIINETYPAEKGSSVMHTAGKKTTSKSEMDYSNNTLYNANQKTAYYVLVPPTQTIVDPEDNSSLLPVFTSQDTITVGNQPHTVYKYNGTSRNINAIAIRDSDAETKYYSYVGTDTYEKLVNASDGTIKSDIAQQLPTMSGVITYNSIPTSLTTGTTIVANDYVYVIAPTVTLNNATTYLVNQSNMNITTETLGTFTINNTEYTVKCTPSQASTVVTAWK